MVERLVCRPRLPLVAGLDAGRPAVHVWETPGLRQVGSVGADSPAYADDRAGGTPAVAWHPHEPSLMVALPGRVVRWTAAGASDVDGVAPAYSGLAFSPDGRELWASPSGTGSAILDVPSGVVSSGPWWDTGIAPHPAGGLVATVHSEQGATHVLFALVDGRGPMRVLRKALILAADSYAPPIFSRDGRYLAIRGNAYENSLDVFAFPSLELVLKTTLGQPYPGYPPPADWLEKASAWSRHNIAFANQSGVLWVGTRTGPLVELDLANRTWVTHDPLPGCRVTALAATAAGDLVVATAAGELALVATPDRPAADAASRDLVTAFVDSTEEVGDGEHVVTDGDRTWTPEDLATVTTAEDDDPMWLRHRAAINKVIRR
ncbi:TolB-like translocation protein [Asanoa ferruginea]|uniref:hypothetical protein n=1 Tax=Asanoa ferruginea TaxID=53367 RepID=UPI001943C69F|nr:hypothetical protein [Asanoa ferruginea]